MAELGYSFIYFLTGVIGPGVCLILGVATPRDDVLPIGGACFVCRYRNEYLGVE